ncbi:MAG TPA: hypothetical protein VLT86_03340 [Vicinamibacterales bacterium]|nr:hypothetical protein [Vicinamibacterales bacterium]
MNAKTLTVNLVRTASAIALLTAACSSRPSTSPPRPVPAGPGATIGIGVPSASSHAPSIAARPPYAAIAWTATMPDGHSSIYLATSVDNGGTFSAPQRIADVQAPPDVSAPSPRVLLGWTRFTADDPRMPEIHVVWREEASQAFRAVASVDDGHTFAPEQADENGWPVTLPIQAGLKMPPGQMVQRAMHDVKPGHHAAAYDECGTLVVTWDDGTAETEGSHVTLRRLIRGGDGALVELQTIPLSSTAPAANPDVASLRGGVAVAWETGGPGSQIAVRRVGFQSICQAPVPDNSSVEIRRTASAGD